MIVDQRNQNPVEQNRREKNSTMRRPFSIASGVSRTRARLRPSPRLRPKRGPCTTRPSRSKMCAPSWYGSPVLNAKNSSVTEIEGLLAEGIDLSSSNEQRDSLSNTEPGRLEPLSALPPRKN